jgi:capsular exopolysaccharide synthesis family protein
LREDEKISYKQTLQYNKPVKTPWFTLTVSNIEKLTAPKYTFYFTSKDDYYDTYIGGLSVALVSEFSSIIKLNYSDNVALRAQEILNAIAHTYIRKSIQEKTKSAQLTLGFIDSQLQKINSKLTTSEMNLKNYKVENNVVNIEGKVALSSENVSKYEAEELNIKTEINILNNLQHFMQTHKDLNGLTLGTVKFTDTSLLQLIQRLQKMSDQRRLLLVDYTEIHPEVIKLTQSIASTKNAIESAIENSLRQLTQRDQDIKETLAKYRKAIQALPGQEKSLAELARPLKVNESVYEYLLQKKAETAILKSSTIANARVIDKAIADYMPIKPKRKLIVIVGIILGLILGIAQAFLREFMITTVRTVEDVEKLTSLPLYGVIPLKKDKMTNNIYEEAFRNIRTNLQFLPGHHDNKVIAITSSVSGEGKTTITAGLAKVLAQSKKKVIVLDLDMRKASIHKQFDLNNNIGISNYLTSQNTLTEVIKQTDVYGLNIITTGTLPPNPSELILSDEFRELLEELKKHYDFIVMDTPPAGLVTDATILMNYADITFTVVRANYSRKEFVKNIDRMAKEHSQNRMGVILNATLIGKEYGYGYGASYAYGYGNSQYYKNRG